MKRSHPFSHTAGGGSGLLTVNWYLDELPLVQGYRLTLYRTVEIIASMPLVHQMAAWSTNNFFAMVVLDEIPLHLLIIS